MTIEGLQKLTLLDYPGHTACTVFLAGCNLRCPFCHNYALALGEAPAAMDEGELLAFLKKRQGLLDGVCFTGGEPLLRAGLPELLKQVKALGFAVKLDTNGTLPDRLKEVVTAGLVDYVAMDLKNAPHRIGETAGRPGLDLAPMEESVRFLLTGPVDYEFRTTVAAELHTEKDLTEIARWIKGAKRYLLQPFKLSEQVPDQGLTAPPEKELRSMLAAVREILPEAQLRGI